MLKENKQIAGRSHKPRPRAIRICFVSPNIYPLLDPSLNIQMTGGAEAQQICIGAALVDKGYSVHFITRDFGQKDPCQIDEFTIHKTCRTKGGIPGFRFFYPRAPSLWQALQRADADIYYVRGAGYAVGLVARFARLNDRRTIFAVAHDANVDPNIRKLPTLRDQWIYKYGVRSVDAIVVQTNHQADLLRKNFGRSAYLIRNAWPQNRIAERTVGRDLVLWVAMFRDIKQPDHFVRLAASMPDLQFVMVGGPHHGSEVAYRNIVSQSRGIPNLDVVGFKTLEETEEYYRRALTLVNTSSHEGFPNTFLQAWAQGIPVVSYVDPDRIVSTNCLGRIARDEDDLPLALRDALQLYKTCSNKIRDYYNANHSTDGAVRKYETLFDDLYLSRVHGRIVGVDR